MHDPVRALWDELERLDCDPHGPEHAFRARCPAHDGDSRDALAVKEGVGGVALVHCWAYHCTARQIVAALGQPVGWLFPDYEPEYVNGRRRHRRPRRNTDAMLAALGIFELGRVPVEEARPPPGPAGCVADGQRFYVAEFCPACGAPGLWMCPVVREAEPIREVVMACWNGCEQDRIREAARDRALSRA